MIDYRYASAFLTVARLGSINRAAETLNVAQSAISRQIKLFEESLGADVFLRGSRGIRLTPKGQSLFKKLSDTDSWIRTDFFSEFPPLRIGGLEAVLNIWLGEKLKQAVAGELPSKLILRPMNNDSIEKALADGEIDIGLSSVKIESEWVSSRKLYTERVYIVSKTDIDVKQIEKYTWIGVARAEYLKRLAKDKEPARIIQAGSLDLLFRLVKSGHGIAAVAESLIPEKGVKSYLTKLANEAIYLNLPTYQHLPGHLKKFIDRFCFEQ
jgi:DNA-binding transcriptional LysR family regulator